MPKRSSRTSGKTYGILIDPRESDLSVQDITSQFKTLMSREELKGKVTDETKLSLLLEQGPAIGIKALNRSEASTLSEKLQAHKITASPILLGGTVPQENESSLKEEVVLSWDTIGLPPESKPVINKSKADVAPAPKATPLQPEVQVDDGTTMKKPVSPVHQATTSTSLRQSAKEPSFSRFKIVFICALSIAALLFLSNQFFLDRADENTMPVQDIPAFESAPSSPGPEGEGADPLILEMNQRQRRAQALELFINAQEFCQMGATSRCAEMTCQAAEIDPQLQAAERHCLDLLRSVDERSQELMEDDENRLQETADDVESNPESAGSEQ